MKAKRDLERSYPTSQFVAKLRRFADAVETGEAFTIQIAGERIRVPERARFSIEHERDGSAEEIEFQIRWKNAGEAPARAPSKATKKRPAKPRRAAKRARA